MIGDLIGEVTITQTGMLILIVIVGWIQWRHERECVSHRRLFHKADERMRRAIVRLETLAGIDPQPWDDE